MTARGVTTRPMMASLQSLTNMVARMPARMKASSMRSIMEVDTACWMRSTSLVRRDISPPVVTWSKYEVDW